MTSKLHRLSGLLRFRGSPVPTQTAPDARRPGHDPSTQASASAATPIGLRYPVLRDPDAFRVELFAVVETEMAKLTDASAVDEWHREVLDPRIAAEVEQEVRRIEMAARVRNTTLSGELSAIQAQLSDTDQSVVEADAALERARRAVRVARARLDERRTGETTESIDSVVGPDSDAQITAIRTEIETQRRSIARALKSLRIQSEPQLRSASLAADQAVRELDRRIAEQERAVESAAADLEAARDRYRGAGPIAEPATPTAEPHRPTAPQPATDAGQREQTTGLGVAA